MHDGLSHHINATQRHIGPGTQNHISDNTSNHPAISITLSINPPKFTRGSESLSTPTISITATSQASEPNFICTDLRTGSPLQLETTKGPKRPQFSFALSGRDDAYFITL
ncbi:hypothetical protein HZ326_16142 [Fusarium oxysporum f. sp. albedinis]|nr:hypothetical protein HZ326_16142 [Fusarium oxysporum f. sp. albedinis]